MGQAPAALECMRQIEMGDAMKPKFKTVAPPREYTPGVLLWRTPEEILWMFALKYAMTKKRWWKIVGKELDPGNHEADKLLFEAEFDRRRG